MKRRKREKSKKGRIAGPLLKPPSVKESNRKFWNNYELYLRLRDFYGVRYRKKGEVFGFLPHRGNLNLAVNWMPELKAGWRRLLFREFIEMPKPFKVGVRMRV